MQPDQPTPAPARTDATTELAAMRTCVRVLEPLDGAARRRAVSYLYDRYGAAGATVVEG